MPWCVLYSVHARPDPKGSLEKSALTLHQYMWATRMGHAPNMASMEKHFYEASIRHLDASAATGDRLMDCIRAAFLLSAFQYMNGRHHSVRPPPPHPSP